MTSCINATYCDRLECDPEACKDYVPKVHIYKLGDDNQCLKPS